MKAHSIDWSHLEPYENSLDLKAAQRLAGVLTIGGRVFRAVVPALAIIMAAAWLIARPELLLYLQVSVWSAGFVFLALATGKVDEGGHWQLAMKLVAEEIGIGMAVGLLLTGMACWVLKIAKRRQWLTEIWIQVPIVAWRWPVSLRPRS